MNSWRHSGPPAKLQTFYRAHAGHVLTSRGLKQQNLLFDLPGCRLSDLQALGYQPAFLDRKSGESFASKTSTASGVQGHVLDGLPDEFVVRRSRGGRVTAVCGSIIPGYLKNGEFLPREEVMQRMRESSRAMDRTLANT